MKIGSLFDGSGGFPLAASMCGIKPIWASEVEPYPIAVTKSRFPNMKHLGSVTDINGAEVEPVDIITFGSPCQDLSVAGKRAGLKHEVNGDDETTRSGLFMEAVRIIKEMREKTNGDYPKWAIWENVPGAFSSNKGEDFRIVLEELIKTVEPNAVMPPVPAKGWPYADCYYGDGWSLAYRVLDAQFWGVPQRRRRIYLVLDLTGERAGSVLFEREGLRGHFEESGTTWQATAGDAENCTGAADQEGGIPYTLKIRSGCEGGGKGALIQTDKSATLSTLNDQYLFQPMSLMEENWSESDVKNSLRAGESKVSHAVVQPVAYSFDSLASNSMKSNNPHSGCRQVEIAKTLDTTDPNPCKNQGGIAVVQKVYSIENHPADSRVNIDESGKVQTLTSRMGTGGGNVPMILEATPIHDKATRYQGGGPTRNGDGAGNGLGIGQPGEPTPTLSTGDRHMVAYEEKTFAMTTGSYMQVTEEVAPTLMARDWKDPTCVATKYIVRRLTPTECARLQGFPDTWGHPRRMDSITDGDYRFWLGVRKLHAAINGKQVKDFTEEQIMTWYNKLHTDSSEYKLWGNGIALPCALYVMEGIAEVSAE